MKGLFITFEGGEGVGKSTQLARLAQRFEAAGQPVRITREPGAGQLGQKLREILLNDLLAPKAELLLYLADRAQHVHEELTPWLACGQIVLCDRFLDSSEVYQGVSRGLGVEFVRGLHKWLLPHIWPDLTILLDMAPTQGLKRVAGRSVADRLESENLAFHEAVRQGFLQQAAHEPGRIKVVDAANSLEQTEKAIWELVEPVWQKWLKN